MSDGQSNASPVERNHFCVIASHMQAFILTFFMHIIKSNHMIFLMQFGINKHLDSCNFVCLWKKLLMLIYSKLDMKLCDYPYLYQIKSLLQYSCLLELLQVRLFKFSVQCKGGGKEERLDWYGTCRWFFESGNYHAPLPLGLTFTPHISYDNNNNCVVHNCQVQLPFTPL